MLDLKIFDIEIEHSYIFKEKNIEKEIL